MRHQLSKLAETTAQCWICGLTRPTHVHHVNGDHNDNASNNRATRCVECHVGLHKRQILLDNDDLAEMRVYFESRHPERFKGQERNPFDRPNVIGPSGEQLRLCLGP